ncbi:MAG: HAD-IC family P-type ATPase [Candidatus Liptonbacteria bacterium]|nr:HAD-IC family P-type ATPase [Candidatus Liptonbacteria bacterium]
MDPNQKPWHVQIPADLERLFRIELRVGLSSAEASRRLVESGPNQLPLAPPTSGLVLFLRQFQSPLIYILLAAAVVVFALREVTDASIIFVVLVINAIIGAIQEGRAQNTLLALRRYVETSATVLRDGQEDIVPAATVVPGDVIILREGEKVPADARLVETEALRVDEASLTGESRPVHKDAAPLPDGERPPAEQWNLVFQGTSVTGGTARAIVVATGAHSVMGQISATIAQTDTEIPLQGRLRRLSQVIMYAVLGICLLLFALGVAKGLPIRTMFATVVSLAVSIIPEGLPVALTLTLATGVWRMAKRNALVKKLQAVEALGQAQIIAVDKTGTLTRNELVVQKVWVNSTTYQVTGTGYQVQGEFRREGQLIDPVSHPDLVLAGKIATLCANARVFFDTERQVWHVAGDPTEAALLVLGEKVGFRKDDLERELPLVAELPFNYKTKYHVTLHGSGTAYLLTLVGAPESVMLRVGRIYEGGVLRPITDLDRARFEATFREMSATGLRVVAFGFRELPDSDLRAGHEQLLDTKHVTLVGFFGMSDSLRPEVPEAVRAVNAAGVRVAMITGDYPLTAQAIAREAGIYREGDSILTDADFGSLSQAELDRRLGQTSVFARITPEHKMQIIQGFQRRGEVVAMTGDGVNDAPSLVAADLGVAMGKIGTEVAKEAADIVLLDDNFGTITAAIEEGRSIYQTIRKVILYLFSTSLAEAATIIVALLLGWPLPLLASQIIWLNLVTDGFLTVALGMEPTDPEVIRRPFQKPSRFILDQPMLPRMLIMAAVMTIGALYLFGELAAVDLNKAMAITLTVLAVVQWLNAWNCRSEHRSIFQQNPFSNPHLVGATVIVISLQFLAMYTEPLRSILHLSPLAPLEWLAVLLVAAPVVVADEIWRLSNHYFDQKGRRYT